MTQTRQDGITLKQWLPLVGLTCCAFVFNTSEFMPIGLLTDIARWRSGSLRSTPPAIP